MHFVRKWKEACAAERNLRGGGGEESFSVTPSVEVSYGERQEWHRARKYGKDKLDFPSTVVKEPFVPSFDRWNE